MLVRKIALSVFAAALLLAANVRVVYSVSVGGTDLPGAYSAGKLSEGEAGARAAAEEIARKEADTASYTASSRLTLRAPDGDGTELSRALLENTGGVASAWAVYVGGTGAGIVRDPTALGEVLDSILAQGAASEAVTAGFTSDITLRNIFIPEGQEDDLMQLARSIRDMTQVVSVTGDGTVRYG